MKRISVLLVVIMLFSIVSFTAEQGESVGDICIGLIKSGKVKEIAIVNGIFSSSKYAVSKQFSMIGKYILLLQKDEYSFYLNLKKLKAFSYDKDDKKLYIYIP